MSSMQIDLNEQKKKRQASSGGPGADKQLAE